MQESSRQPADANADEKTFVRAVEYVRMSTDHQRYSTQNQSEAIRRYADARGFEIVRTYADEGKSGLRMAGRDALKSLIEEVSSGSADFRAILVYDVSRWGRFQDADESAYYEYLCKRAGIIVHYCAEQFENDGSPIATIVKGLKRAMAGEYSRELSNRVFAGQYRLAERGFLQGGAAGFGLRRVLLDEAGRIRGDLATGEHKSIQTDRVMLAPGPAHELAIIREIYRAFVLDKKGETFIADKLNRRGVPTDRGRPWSRATVHEVLINEKYVGASVWNRTSFKLKKKRVQNAPDMWLRTEGAFPAIVDRELYDAAQVIIRARTFHMADKDMLAALGELLRRRGTLSTGIINEAENIPSSNTYRRRFGGLMRAYSLVGFKPQRSFRHIEINRTLRRTHPQVLDAMLAGLTAAGGDVRRDHATDLVDVNGEFRFSVVIAECRTTGAGALRWLLRFDAELRPDITVAVRMDRRNERPIDFYLLPRADLPGLPVRLREENGLALDAYRIDDLDVSTGWRHAPV